MASNKNITMKEYNGTDYDTLYPKNTSQQVLLNDGSIHYSDTNTVNGALRLLDSRFSSLTSGSLNDLTKTGLYFCNADTTNRPPSPTYTTWVVQVIATVNGNLVHQVAKAAVADGVEYERWLYQGTWSDWFITGTRSVYMPQNTNIDTFETSGWFLYNRSTDGLHHVGTFPITDTYGILVNICSTSSGYRTQILRPNILANNNNTLYMRFMVNGTWGAWSSYNDRFSTVSNVSLNTLQTTGLYFCLDCTYAPLHTSYSNWIVEVVVSASGNTIKQIARPASADTLSFERHYSNSEWSSWLETSPPLKYVGPLNEYKYFRKPGAKAFGSFIVMGTLGGVGGFILCITIQNSEIQTIQNLRTSSAWNVSSDLVSFYYGTNDTNNYGYLGIKTGSVADSSITIIGA